MRHSTMTSAVLTAILLAFAELAAAQTLNGPVSDKPLDEIIGATGSPGNPMVLY